MGNKICISKKTIYVLLLSFVIIIIFSFKTVAWQTYIINNVSFKFPPDWIVETNDIPTVERKFIQVIKDPQEIYSLIFSIEENFNKETGRPFTDIYEFIKMPRTIKTTSVDGQLAVQPLPRAGSEYVYLVAFFSKDSKNILILQLNIPEDGEKIKEGQKIFNKILSTFKFLGL